MTKKKQSKQTDSCPKDVETMLQDTEVQTCQRQVTNSQQLSTASSSSDITEVDEDMQQLQLDENNEKEKQNKSVFSEIKKHRDYLFSRASSLSSLPIKDQTFMKFKTMDGLRILPNPFYMLDFISSMGVRKVMHTFEENEQKKRVPVECKNDYNAANIIYAPDAFGNVRPLVSSKLCFEFYMLRNFLFQWLTSGEDDLFSKKWCNLYIDKVASMDSLSNLFVEEEQGELGTSFAAAIILDRAIFYSAGNQKERATFQGTDFDDIVWTHIQGSNHITGAKITFTDCLIPMP